MDSTLDASRDTADDVALDMRGILRAVLRRWFVVLVFTAAVGGATYGLLSITPPVWRAETKLLIENREVDLSDPARSGGDRAAIDQETVASQVQLLTSRDLARRVADRHKLSDLPEFDGSRGTLLDTILVAVGFGRDPMRTSPEERVIDAFMEHLKVYQVDGSRVVVVEFSSRDRQLAAEVANTVAAEYMALQGEAKRRTSEDQTRWLGDEIERLRGKVRDAEGAVEAYRNRSGLLLGSNNTTIARQQITDLTNAIAQARSDQATASARADQLAKLLSGGDLDAAADVVDGETFRTLRAREAALRNRQSELVVTLLPGHPQMQSLNSQIDDIVRQEGAEAQRALAALRNEARIADNRVASLSAQLETVKAASAANGTSEVELRALEREAASQRSLLEGLLVRYSEAIARQNVAVLPADARVISRASVPTEPVFPKLVPMTAAATLAAFLFCLGWLITAEFVSGRALVRVTSVPDKPKALGTNSEDDARFESAKDADPAFRLRTPVEPALEAAPRRAAAPAGLSVGVVEDAVLLHGALIADGTNRVALVSVSGGDRLKPMIEDLSIAAVEQGTRVVVVDTVAAHAGRSGPGLSDLVAGQAAFGEVISRNRFTRAHEIGVGSTPVDLDGKAAEVFETVLEALESAYDLVVLSLGELQPSSTRRRLLGAARHVVLIGLPDDPRVAVAHREVLAAGVETVTVIPPAEFQPNVAA